MATTRVASSQEFDAGRGHTDKVQVRKTCCGPSLGLWMPVESRTPSGLVFAAAARRSALPLGGRRPCRRLRRLSACSRGGDHRGESRPIEARDVAGVSAFAVCIRQPSGALSRLILHRVLVVFIPWVRPSSRWCTLHFLHAEYENP